MKLSECMPMCIVVACGANCNLNELVEICQ